MSTPLPPPGTTREGTSAVAIFADTAAFAVVASSCVAIPAIFSIALTDVFALPKTILAVALAGILAALLAVGWIASGTPVARPRQALLAAAVVGFIGWNLAAAWFAIDRTQAIFGERWQYQGLGSTLAYVVFLLAAWTTVRGPWRRTILLLSVAAGATMVAAYAVIQRMGLDPIWSTLPEDRVFSTIGQANALAAYLVLTVPLVLSLALGRRRPAQLAVAGVVALELLALVFTLSRGGYLGVTVAAIVLVAAAWWRTRPRLPRRRSLAIAAVVALAALVSVLTVPDVRAVAERVAARALLTADLGEGSTRMHLDQWSVGVAIVAEHPLVGIGQDTYVLVFDRYRDRVLSPERAAVLREFRPESPHNVYIAIAGGAGLPTLAAYLAIVASVAIGLLRAARSLVERGAWLIGAGLLAAIAGHLVTDGFVTAETSSTVLFWIVLGTGAALVAEDRPRLIPG